MGRTTAVVSSQRCRIKSPRRVVFGRISGDSRCRTNCGPKRPLPGRLRMTLSRKSGRLSTRSLHSCQRRSQSRSGSRIGGNSTPLCKLRDPGSMGPCPRWLDNHAAFQRRRRAGDRWDALTVLRAAGRLDLTWLPGAGLGGRAGIRFTCPGERGGPGSRPRTFGIMTAQAPDQARCSRAAASGASRSGLACSGRPTIARSRPAARQATACATTSSRSSW